jgi:sensor histidine kinase YesM
MINHRPQTLPKKSSSRAYYWAQLAFWGCYLFISWIFVALWGQMSGAAAAIFISHTLLLMCASHALRQLYHLQTGSTRFAAMMMQLLWVLPLSAMAIQSLLHLFIYGVLVFTPLQSGIHAFNMGSFIGYSINTTIILTLWSILYLLRSEFSKRRDTEIAHWRDQAKLRDMELQFLRSQINSHFLFNSLNNLRALILEDPQAARQGLADLATLLRGLLQVETHTTVTLREELDWVRGYLALEALQFEQRLQYEFAIDESLLNAQVPPLLLQTLVENAIKHGIASRRQGGLISLRAQLLSAEQWQLEVENPAAELPALHQGNGVGLANTRARLTSAFGTQATLALQLGERVIARVTIPLKTSP